MAESTAEAVSEDTISILEVFEVIKRNFWGSLATIFACTAIAVIIAFQLPKRYKAKAVLSIQSNYFRNPLVSDLIPETSDPTELNSLRQSLLRLALSDEFVDELGSKYNMFKYPLGAKEHVLERETFLKKIEYFSLSSTNFQIAVAAPKPEAAYEMTREILDRMTYTLIEGRYRMLMKARDAIQAQVGFLSRALQDASSAKETAHLQRELDKINSNLTALRLRFTDAHPDVYKMKEQAAALKSRLKGQQDVPREVGDDDLTKAFVTPSSKAPIQDIYNDLLKKLSNLNIVLEMEKDRDSVSYLGVIEKPAIPPSPVFPNKKEFALFGFLIGVVLAFLQALYIELTRFHYVSPEKGAVFLDAPLLGELPVLADANGLLLLEAPQRREEWKMLGLPGKAE